MVALAVALALHALVAFVVWRVEPSDDRPEKPIEVELRALPSPPPPEKEKDEAPAPPQVEQRKKRPERVTPQADRSPASESEVPPGSGAIGDGEAAGKAGVGEGVGLPVQPGPVDLFAPGSLSKSMQLYEQEDGLLDRPGQGRLGDDTPAAEQARVEGRVGRALGGVVARSRVEAGLVDPYFARLSEAARADWTVKPSALGLLDGEDAASQWSNFQDSKAAVARAYGKTGSPFGPGPHADFFGHSRPFDRNDTRGGGTVSEQAELCIAWNNGDLAFVQAWVIVQLVQSPDGSPVSTRVLEAEAPAHLIASARASIMEAARSRRAPEHGFGLGGERIQSVWRLQVKVFATNPTCVSFDESLGVALDVRALPETRTKTTIELVAVYGGETEGEGPKSPMQVR